LDHNKTGFVFMALMGYRGVIHYAIMIIYYKEMTQTKSFK